VELLLFTASTLSVGSGPTYYANSTKFSFQTSSLSPHSVQFFQWATGGYDSNNIINYWTYANLYTYSSGSHDLKLWFGVGWTIYMTGFKVGVLLVAQSGTAYYTTYSQDGGSFNGYFTDNLGVPTSSFG
jgi:hypothetical protein